MTIEEAITEETRRYVAACRMANAGLTENGRAWGRRHAHICYLALRRLRHYAVSQHEAAIAATPTVHAHSV